MRPLVRASRPSGKVTSLPVKPLRSLFKRSRPLNLFVEGMTTLSRLGWGDCLHFAEALRGTLFFLMFLLFVFFG